MFCKYCGTELDDNSNICAACAAKEQESAKETAGAAKFATEVMGKKSNMIIAAAAAAIVLIVIILAAALSTPAYEKPVEYFITGISNGSYKTMKKAMPKFVIEELEDNSYFDMEDMIEEAHDEMIDEYGKSVKLTYKVKRKKSIDKDDLEDIEDMIDDYYDKEIKVSKGYELRVEMILKAKGESEKEKIDINVYKINGKWYLLEMPL